MDKLVSVIMPAYNAAPYIEKAIQSILDQSYSHFELIISDDASTDQTIQEIRRFQDSRISVYEQTFNLGYVENMNTLFRLAQGDYIVIQDADDYSTPSRVEVLLNYLEQHPQVDFVGSSYCKFDDTGKREVKKALLGQAEIQQAFHEMHNPLPLLNGTLMLRRHVLDQGFYFRDLHYVRRGQDDDWLFRLSEHFTASNVEACLYYYRSNTSSMTLNPSLITYPSLSTANFIRFLKTQRISEGIDLLQSEKWEEMDAFFDQEKRILLKQEPAYIESYIAHQYLALGDRFASLKWFVKALLKNPGNVFFWKKIGYVMVNGLVKS